MYIKQCVICGTDIKRKYKSQMGRTKTCSHRCSGQLQRNNLTPQERFEKKYIPEPMSGCWLWIAGVCSSGYGNILVDGKAWGAHRYSWVLHNGPIPEIDGVDHRGTCVLHKCDTPSCVNPDHLFLGTHQDNVADMVAKGRGNHLKGESHPESKLTEQKVREIRSAKGTTQEIADKYNTCRSQIRGLKSGERWKHVVGGFDEK